VPVVGAKVTLLNGQGIFVTEAYSDSEGKYVFRKFGMVPGKYTLRSQAEGYKDFEKTVEEITTATTTDLIIKMGAS
jgi:hypothetical protein